MVFAIPALAFLVGRIPLGSQQVALPIRAAVFAAAASLLLVSPRRRTRSAAERRVVPLLLALLLVAGLLSAGVTRLVAITALVATSEEIVFRWLAVDLVLVCWPRRSHVLTASLATSIAFATSHVAAGGVPWSPHAWWALVASGTCLVLIRFTSGLAAAVSVHLVVNLLIATGYLGAPVLPGYEVLVPVAFTAAGSAALLVPLYSASRGDLTPT